MTQRIALVLFIGFVGWLFARDLRRRAGVSKASWLVLLWVVIFASRPVSTWLSYGGGTGTVDAYLEGNPLERSIFLVLIFLGAAILLKRRIALGALLRQNVWLSVFFVYCLVSVVWSDYPFVAFKRWFKDFGNVVIVLVLLTEKNPIEAINAVFVRCAYLLVPLSMLFIRYFPEFGRMYGGYSGNDLMYVGVATHKNTLGAMLLTACAFLVWDLIRHRTDESRQGGRFDWIDSALILCIASWLLIIADSATALLCTLLAVALLLATSLGPIRRKLRFVEVYVIAGAALWLVLDGMFNLTELVVLSVGRDMSLTSRTGAWDMLIAQQDNVLLGAGFKSFWAGDRMARLWQNPDLPRIVQAHSGYVETYLNGGALGIVFLSTMLLAGFAKIKRHLVTGTDFSRLRFTFFVITLFYNYSEASFNQLSLLWFVTLLVIIEGPQPVEALATMRAAHDTVRPPTALRPGPWRPEGAVDRWRKDAARPRFQFEPARRTGGEKAPYVNGLRRTL
jgi:exopolysaccharide production protein ExoQ